MSLGKAGVQARRQSLTRAHAMRTETHPEEGLRVVTTTHAMQTPVLVLNASYEPINICGARRALVLVLKGVARTEEEQGMELHSARVRMSLPSAELTLDHVIPRSRGGTSTWENLVAACHSCNRRKGNHLLHELEHMKLIREPRPFTLHTSRHIMRMIGHSDQKWRKYLYY